MGISGSGFELRFRFGGVLWFRGCPVEEDIEPSCAAAGASYVDPSVPQAGGTRERVGYCLWRLWFGLGWLKYVLIEFRLHYCSLVVDSYRTCASRPVRAVLVGLLNFPLPWRSQQPEVGTT